MITASVGPGKSNKPDDVKVVQTLLNSRIDLLVPLRTLLVNGKFDEATKAAVLHVQSKFTPKPDGIVTPYKKTMTTLWPVKYANPTGKGIRKADKFGAGHHGASRGSRIHDGADYNCTAGQQVKSPLSGKVTKISRPYSSGTDAAILSGVQIVASDGTTCQVWYMQPRPGIVGSVVEAGKTIIGTAKTLQNRYPGITDHLHVRIHRRNGTKVDPATVIR